MVVNKCVLVRELTRGISCDGKLYNTSIRNKVVMTGAPGVGLPSDLGSALS